MHPPNLGSLNLPSLWVDANLKALNLNLFNPANNKKYVYLMSILCWQDDGELSNPQEYRAIKIWQFQSMTTKGLIELASNSHLALLK